MSFNELVNINIPFVNEIFRCKMARILYENVGWKGGSRFHADGNTAKTWIEMLGHAAKRTRTEKVIVFSLYSELRKQDPSLYPIRQEGESFPQEEVVAKKKIYAGKL
jgi:hypothetical protein